MDDFQKKKNMDIFATAIAYATEMLGSTKINYFEIREQYLAGLKGISRSQRREDLNEYKKGLNGLESLMNKIYNSVKFTSEEYMDFMLDGIGEYLSERHDEYYKLKQNGKETNK